MRLIKCLILILRDIFKGAKEEIIIIDNYADKSILDMITNLNVKVTIVTRKFNLLKDLDIKKYAHQKVLSCIM